MDASWRPENWTKIKRELANTSNIWGTAIPMVSHEEQIVEATAARIIDELLKSGILDLKDLDQVAKAVTDKFPEGLVGEIIKGVENGRDKTPNKE